MHSQAVAGPQQPRAVRREPYSLHAEEAVLGSVLKEPGCIAGVAEVLQPDDFYEGATKTTWAAMLALYREGIPIDLYTLAGRLEKLGMYDEVAGMAYLTSLNLATPTALLARCDGPRSGVLSSPHG